MGNFLIFEKIDKMRRKFLLLIPIFFLLCALVQAQGGYHKAARALRPDNAFDNVLVQKLFTDAQASGFVIWIKAQVPLHQHALHSETVVILAGHAEMSLGDAHMTVRRGDIIFIPQGTPHAVTVHKGVLKVLSIQAPEFDGTDRILLN
jgi:quercetin dioxygenase-like cupin family protein